MATGAVPTSFPSLKSRDSSLGFAKSMDFVRVCDLKRIKSCRTRMSVSLQWPGLPVGVKFDPSDAKLLEHLAAKCGVGNSKAHLLIDKFIHTLEED
ncbi:hypothetical protein REPUB_Repub13aG0022900 [Reevesia pubescens]